MQIEKRQAFLINCAYFVLIAALIFLGVRYVLPLIAPFVIALLIACLVRRPAIAVSKQLHVPYKLTAAILLLLFYGLIGLGLTMGGIRAVTWVRDLMWDLPSIYENHLEPLIAGIFDAAERSLAHIDISLTLALEELESQIFSRAADMVSSLSLSVVSSISGLASSLPGLFIKFLLTIISSFFIVMDFDLLVGFCLRQMSDKAKTVAAQVKEYVVGTLFVCIRSYILIMSITFVEMSLGLTLLKVENAALIALITAIFDILPVLGTGGIMVPWAVITALRGNFTLAIGLFLLYIAITVIRNIIEPKIVGSQIGLHPVVTLASMFVGLQLFGAIGLFGCPIGLSLLRYLNDLGVIHFFRVSDDSNKN